MYFGNTPNWSASWYNLAVDAKEGFWNVCFVSIDEFFSQVRRQDIKYLFKERLPDHVSKKKNRKERKNSWQLFGNSHFILQALYPSCGEAEPPELKIMPACK